MLTLKQIYSDDELLPEFMQSCYEKGFTNNASIQSIKFDYFEESAFFAVIENNKILTFSGVHNFDYDNQRFYRVGFRGASIYSNGFKIPTSKNFLISSILYGVLFPIGMLYAKKHFKTVDPKFVMTTNADYTKVDTAGRSFAMDRLARQGKMPGTTLLYEKITYLNTLQNIWLLDPDVFINTFNTHYQNKIEIKC